MHKTAPIVSPPGSQPVGPEAYDAAHHVMPIAAASSVTRGARNACAARIAVFLSCCMVIAALADIAGTDKVDATPGAARLLQTPRPSTIIQRPTEPGETRGSVAAQRYGLVKRTGPGRIRVLSRDE